MQAQIAKNLGFDPENPMVKLEISRIVRKGLASYPGVAMGHQPPVKEPKASSVSPVTQPQSKPVWQKPLYFLIGSAALIIAVGLFIVLRAGRRKP